MAQFGVNDPSWAEIIGGLGGLFDAGNKSKAFLTGVTAQQRLLEAEEKRRQLSTAAGAIDAYTKTLPPTLPEPFVGNAGPILPPSPQDQAAYDAKRNMAIAQYGAGMYRGNSFADVVKGSNAAIGSGNLLVGGIPADKMARDVMQTQISGVGMDIPGYDEAKTPTKNYAILDAQGQQVGRGATRDMVNDAASGSRIVAPPGGSVVQAGPAEIDPNPFKNPGSMLQNLHALEQKRQREGLTIDETQRAAVMLGQLFPETTETKDVNGRLTPVTGRKTPIPPQLQQLQLLTEEFTRHGPAGAPPVASGVDAGGNPIVAPAPPVGGLIGRPAATAAPAPVEPIVAPAPAQQVGGGFRTEPPIAPGNMATLRDDFRSEPSFQMFTKSRPAYDAMLEAAKTDSAASDLILIYSFAQIGDPGSSVKEGETQMIERNGALMERAKGQLMQMTQGTGKLTANQRIDLVNAAHAKMMQLEGAYNARGAFYGDIAKRQGGNPLDVVQQFGKVLPPNPKEINMYAAPTASGPTGPLPQQREITFDPITGAVR